MKETPIKLLGLAIGIHQGDIMNKQVTAADVETYMVGFPKLIDLLQECKTRGIKGKPGQCRECVVAKLLERVFGNDIKPIVLPESEQVKCLFGLSWQTISMPVAVREFATSFDNFRFPDLIADGSRS